VIHAGVVAEPRLGAETAVLVGEPGGFEGADRHRGAHLHEVAGPHGIEETSGRQGDRRREEEGTGWIEHQFVMVVAGSE
jgi:hypothetical protein